MSDMKITAQNVQSGQVFYCSWGMEQTNIDWYQIVTVSDSKKSARFRQIHSVKVSDGPQTMTGQSMPDIGNYLEEGPFMKILKEWEGELHINMDHGSLGVWDGKPKRFSTYA